MTKQIRITEIFLSLQGESTFVGLPTFFIRLTGCPLRCGYCDTAYAFQGGELQPVDELVEAAKQSGTKYVCVTGGEPLAQPDCLLLLTALCDAGFSVNLETSGALSVKEVDERVVKIIDIKTPDSGEVDKNLWANIEFLNQQDQIKFVICSRADYDWAKKIIKKHTLGEKMKEILFSPSAEQVPAQQLADWIIDDKLAVRFQVQLHKILWGNEQGV